MLATTSGGRHLAQIITHRTYCWGWAGHNALPLVLPTGREAAEAAAGRMRLAAYAANRADVVRCLLAHLATLPEAIEIGRVTGLTLGQARLAMHLP